MKPLAIMAVAQRDPYSGTDTRLVNIPRMLITVHFMTLHTHYEPTELSKLGLSAWLTEEGWAKDESSLRTEDRPGKNALSPGIGRPTQMNHVRRELWLAAGQLSAISQSEAASPDTSFLQTTFHCVEMWHEFPVAICLAHAEKFISSVDDEYSSWQHFLGILGRLTPHSHMLPLHPTGTPGCPSRCWAWWQVAETQRPK